MLQIKAAALRDVGQWLVTIRSQAVAVGKGALRKCNNFMSGLGKVGQLVRGLLCPKLAEVMLVTVLKAGLRVLRCGPQDGRPAQWTYRKPHRLTR